MLLQHRVLSITTADSESAENGTLDRFLRSCDYYKVDVVLILRTHQEFPTITQHSSVVKIINTDNAPLSKIRNLALKDMNIREMILTYEWITFLDDDCEVTESISLLMTAPDNIQLICGSLVDFFSKEMLNGRTFRARFWDFPYLYNKACSGTMFFRPETVLLIGLFAEDLGAGTSKQLGEDTDFFLRSWRLKIETFVDERVQTIHPLKKRPMFQGATANRFLSKKYISLHPWLYVVFVTSTAKHILSKCI